MNHIKKRAIIKHKAFITQYIRGSTTPSGYVHQLVVFFISFFQYSYMHKASKSTLQRTRDLHASLDPPSPSRYRHRALQSLCTKHYRRLALSTASINIQHAPSFLQSFALNTTCNSLVTTSHYLLLLTSPRILFIH